MNLNDINNELADVRHVLETLFGDDASQCRIMGGYARRWFMKENNIPFKKEDDILSDIDVFVPFPLLVKSMDRYFSNYESKLLNEVQVKYAIKMLHEMIDTDYDEYHDTDVQNARILISEFYRNYSMHFKDHTDWISDNIATNMKRIKSEGLLVDRQFSINMEDRSVVMPFGSMLQIIFKSDGFSIDDFDIPATKIESYYPFNEIYDYSNTNLSLYEINHLHIVNLNNIVTTIKRLEKYTRYGFTISEDVKNQVTNALMDTDISENLCFIGSEKYE